MYFLSAPLTQTDSDITLVFLAFLLVLGFAYLVYAFIRIALLDRQKKKYLRDLEILDWATNNFAYVSRKFTERGMQMGGISRMTTDEYVELLMEIREKGEKRA